MVTTHVDSACERIDAERDPVEAKQAAFDSFVDRVEDVCADCQRAVREHLVRRG